MNFIASLLSSIGGMFANVNSVACGLMWFDEPECPKSLVK